MIKSTLIIAAVFIAVFLVIFGIDLLSHYVDDSKKEKRKPSGMAKEENTEDENTEDEDNEKNKKFSFGEKVKSSKTLKKLFKSRFGEQGYSVKESATAYLMLLPAVILAFLFIMLPILYSLGYAFTGAHLLKMNKTMNQFVGLDNFLRAFKEIKAHGTLYHAIINTLKFVVGVVPLQIGLALGLAIFVNRKKPGVKIFKVCFFAPVVISLSITAYLWKIILAPGPTGLINAITGIFGAEPVDWLREPSTAMPWIIILSAWQGCGYQMLIFISGLVNIRKELYEAAALDGAGVFKQFWHITLPGLRSTFTFILVTVFIGACRVMIQPMLMTGYQDHTVTLSYFMYYTGYSDYSVGYSSAIALIMTIIIGIITYIQRRALREK